MSEEDRWPQDNDVKFCNTGFQDFSPFSCFFCAFLLCQRAKDIDWSSLKNLAKLGSGTFGVVYMMQDANKNKYAMKVLNKKRVKEMKQEKRVSTEKKLLASMRSPFICKLFGINQDSDGFYLLMELVSGGELRRLIHPEGTSPLF